jgi:hypothetical protein
MVLFTLVSHYPSSGELHQASIPQVIEEIGGFIKVA